MKLILVALILFVALSNAKLHQLKKLSIKKLSIKRRYDFVAATAVIAAASEVPAYSFGTISNYLLSAVAVKKVLRYVELNKFPFPPFFFFPFQYFPQLVQLQTEDVSTEILSKF